MTETGPPTSPPTSPPASSPTLEDKRNAALAFYGIADTHTNAALTDVAAAAAALCGTSIAAIAQVDETFMHVTASVGSPPVHTMPREQTVTEHVLHREGLLEIPDLLADSRFADVSTTLDGTYRFYAGGALRTSTGQDLGALLVIDREPRQLTEAQRTGLQALCRVAASLLQRQSVAALLVDSSLHLEQAAETDPLTGLANRRGLDPVLGALPPGTAIALLDLDYFKAINDTRGHEAGDQVLQAFATYLTETVREGDLPGRWGGEEFLLILPHTDLDGAQAVVDRLRVLWAASGDVTFSAGVTVHEADARAADTVARADAALYEAKQAGRNQVRAR